jgi:ABC-type multidrug transport system ATPase subunit
MPLLSLQNVVAYRGSKPLFNPATFTVGQGEFAIVSADNGVGKTTLLDCIAGLYHNWTGIITKQYREISYLQQTASYVKTLSLRDQATLVIGFDAQRYSRLVNSLSLCKRDRVLLSLLSGGELQRAKLLLALLRRHKILLLDEPLANVDLASRQAVVRELEETKQERATVIVSHPRDTQGVAFKGSVNLELCCKER